MGIIKAAKLVHEYIRRDEDGKVEEIRRAVDGVDLDDQRFDDMKHALDDPAFREQLMQEYHIH